MIVVVSFDTDETDDSLDFSSLLEFTSDLAYCFISGDSCDYLFLVFDVLTTCKDFGNSTDFLSSFCDCSSQCVTPQFSKTDFCDIDPAS